MIDLAIMFFIIPICLCAVANGYWKIENTKLSMNIAVWSNMTFFILAFLFSIYHICCAGSCSQTKKKSNLLDHEILESWESSDLGALELGKFSGRGDVNTRELGNETSSLL
jgi:hypothetical protein